MLTVALVLAVGGIFTVFGSFVFAALNMSRSFSAYTHKDAFERHIKAMIGIALGGLCLALSTLIVGVELSLTLVEKAG